jgi:hypothetical protein
MESAQDPIMALLKETGLRSERLSALGQRANRLKADFLQIDSQMALTFSGIALDASDPEKRKRTTLTARRAYDAIVRLRNDIELSPAEGYKLDTNLHRLKSELQRLGQRF